MCHCPTQSFAVGFEPAQIVCWGSDIELILER